jgi:AraC-like DNA-binding protein
VPGTSSCVLQAKRKRDARATARTMTLFRPVTLEDQPVSTEHGSRLGLGLSTELPTEGLLGERRPGRAGVAQPPFIEKVEAFCQKNYARNIGVAQMADVAKLSRFHFSRLFQKARGISPGQYLYGLRLAMAMRLVQTGEYAVKDIAKQCGFSSSSYFCKAFRRQFGRTPGSVAASRPLPVAPPTPGLQASTAERSDRQVDATVPIDNFT